MRHESLKRFPPQLQALGFVPVDNVLLTVDLHARHAPYYCDRVGFRLAEAMLDAYRLVIKGAAPGR